MKKGKIILFVSSIFACLMIWQACQKDEELATPYKDVETMPLKSADVFDCSTDCIDPDDPEYFVVHDELVIGWAGPDNDKFSKTVEVKYYNTFTHFMLKVMSTNGIADVLMDDESIKYFEGTIPPDEWHEFSFGLETNWKACVPWGFELQITGYGTPAYFTVEYHLIGECEWPRDTNTEVVDVFNPATGKTWMDRNLGASRAATSITDAEAYGDLYQWSRAADGHQIRTSGTTYTLSGSDTPGHDDSFYTE